MAKKLVLVGGGHSHAIALRWWAWERPTFGESVSLTLISNHPEAPYSGMLPGQVAGLYHHQETHIDLVALAQAAGVEFIQDEAIALDLSQKIIQGRGGTRIQFDYLSLDIGSTPQQHTIPGAAQYALGAKPVPQFLQGWQRLQEQVRLDPLTPRQLAIVGGGAGGVELALSMNTHFQQLIPQEPGDRSPITISLFNRSPQLLPKHNFWCRRLIRRALEQQNIRVYDHTTVTAIENHQLWVQSSGKNAPATPQAHGYDHCFLVTPATAAPWLKASGLACDRRGFVVVDHTLRSPSHPFVFAAGDVATQTHHPRPKAGVFAVRQGKPLYDNWCRQLGGQPLRSHRPQKRYLSLIGTGNQRAIASWGWLAWESAGLWRWKNHIDHQFMAQFTPENLPQR